MMLAESDTMNVDFVGKHRLVDHVADDLRMAQQLAVGPSLNVTECVETELNFLIHKFVSWMLGYLEERPFV
jgi:hypothetical protein